MPHNAWQTELDDAVDRLFDRMVEVRRRLHSQPEPSGDERKTSLYLYQLLGDEGFDVRMGPEGCGVIADLPRAADCGGPLVALRADIDALHIHEKNDVEYASRFPGVMHACGHDAHTAIALGAILSLKRLSDGALPRPLPLRGIFQPAEETCLGAKSMVEVGAVDGVGAVFAVHVDPGRKLGRIGVRAGVMTANCDEMQVSIVGRGGHAARPHEAIDPIAAAAQLINALYLFIPFPGRPTARMWWW
jgi:amidohydrolase